MQAGGGAEDAAYELPYATTLELLRDAGLPLVAEILADSPDEAAAAATALPTTTVALKAAGLLHKSDQGGVVLGLDGPDAVRAAAKDLVDRLGDGALPLSVQAHASGQELLVGLRRDPRLGAVIVVGLGGIYTEVLRDVAHVMVPVSPDEARDVLARLRSAPLLEGTRGQAGADIDAIVALLTSLSALAEAHPELQELDLNPVLVGGPGEGAVVVDSRAIATKVDPGTTIDQHPGRDLEPLMAPRSIAVVGVSDDQGKFGAKVYRYLRRHGFDGTLWPVHPAGGEVDGVARLTGLDQLPSAPDLVISAVPARATVEVAKAAVTIGARAMLVHSSDFAEIGPEGLALQKELQEATSAGGLLLAGPNSMGIVSPDRRTACSISAALDQVDLLPGGTAVVSSSGALGSCLSTRLMEGGTGISDWIHAGNEADVTIAQFLAWLAGDDRTRAVGLLLEDVKDGPALARAGQQLRRSRIPAFAFNMARTDGGQSAAQSHTGAMVGSYELRREVLRRGGIVAVDTLEELEDALRYADHQTLPAGRRLAALTFSGGACSIIADESERCGIELPPPTDDVVAGIREVVPSFAAVRNPVDVSFQLIASPDNFRTAVEILGSSDAYNAVLIQFTTNADPAAVRTADALISARDQLSVPLYVARYGGAQLAPDGLARYREAGIPVLDAPDRAVRAIAAVMDAADAIAGRPPRDQRP